MGVDVAVENKRLWVSGPLLPAFISNASFSVVCLGDAKEDLVPKRRRCRLLGRSKGFRNSSSQSLLSEDSRNACPALAEGLGTDAAAEERLDDMGSGTTDAAAVLQNAKEELGSESKRRRCRLLGQSNGLWSSSS